MDLKKHALTILLGFILIFLVIFYIFGGPSFIGQQTTDFFVNREGKNGCCRICYKGVACGNSCIKRASPCTQPPGCACNRRVAIPAETEEP